MLFVNISRVGLNVDTDTLNDVFLNLGIGKVIYCNFERYTYNDTDYLNVYVEIIPILESTTAIKFENLINKKYDVEIKFKENSQCWKVKKCWKNKPRHL
jgi:hypothetical protein